jgi:hypothetical protein
MNYSNLSRAVLFVVLIPLLSHAQNQASTVYFGTCILDFRTDPFEVVRTNASNARESGTSICDENGDLLFYSNGGTSPTAPVFLGGVWNTNGDFLLNGTPFDSAGCLSSFSGAISIPSNAPNHLSGSRFNLLTRDCLESTFSGDGYNSGFTIAEIDMSLDGGNGVVISKYQSVVTYSVATTHKTAHEPITAVLNQNGTDYWVFSYRNDSLYKILLTASGFSSFEPLFPGEGILEVAPDRNHMMVGQNLYRLDPASGDLTFRHSFPQFTKGVFSPDGKVLYVNINNALKQYDLSLSELTNNPYQLTIIAENTQLFLTPNGRIFCFIPNSQEITSQIICPNTIGPACNYNSTAISLNGGYSPTVRPNLPAHFLYKEGGCELEITDENLETTSLQWDEFSETLAIKSPVNQKFKIVNFMSQEMISGNTAEISLFSTRFWSTGIYFVIFGNGETLKWIK